MLVDRKLPETIDTERLGAALARTVPWQAPQALTVFLQGELGAGKTTLVRGLLRAMGVQGSVRSPSYTLLESYELGGHRVLHLDLYRLRSADELEALGLRDEFHAGTLVLIEWPERGVGRLPSPDVCVTLALAGEGRQVRIEVTTVIGEEWSAAVERDLRSQV